MLTTHFMDEAERLCDRLAVIDHGRLIAEGAPRELISQHIEAEVVAGASVLGDVAEPLITLLAFGYGLGSLLRNIEGVPYIHFLASGSICMSVMMAASLGAWPATPWVDLSILVTYCAPGFYVATVITRRRLLK